MSTTLVTAPPTHLIPPNEALGRVSQADVVNLLVVRHREAKEALIAKMEQEFCALIDTLDQDVQVLFAEVGAQVQAQIGRQLQRLNAAGKVFGYRFFTEDVKPRVMLKTAYSYTSKCPVGEGVPLFACERNGASTFFGPDKECLPVLRWEDALLYWLRYPQATLGRVSIHAAVYCDITGDARMRAVDVDVSSASNHTLVPIKLIQPSACVVLHRGMTFLREHRAALITLRDSLKDTAELTAKLHAQMTEHILRTGGVDIEEWLNKL